MTRRIEHYKKDNGAINTNVTINSERVTIKVGSRDAEFYDQIVDEVVDLAERIPLDSKTLRGAYRVSDGMITLRSCNASQILGFYEGELVFVQSDNKVLYQIPFNDED